MTMAYNTQQLFDRAVKAIDENNLFFIEDAVAFLPCDKTTFYRHFPPDSDGYRDLTAVMERNKVRTKASIRAKLHKSRKAAELLALYKLIATDEERKRLSMTHVDLTSGGDKLGLDALQESYE